MVLHIEGSGNRVERRNTVSYAFLSLYKDGCYHDIGIGRWWALGSDLYIVVPPRLDESPHVNRNCSSSRGRESVGAARYFLGIRNEFKGLSANGDKNAFQSTVIDIKESIRVDEGKTVWTFEPYLGMVLCISGRGIYSKCSYKEPKSRETIDRHHGEEVSRGCSITQIIKSSPNFCAQVWAQPIRTAES
jgi:hypothetical protein